MNTPTKPPRLTQPESCIFAAFSEKTWKFGGVSARVLGSGFILSVHVEIYPKDFRLKSGI